MALRKASLVELTKDEWCELYDAIGCTVEYALDEARSRPDKKEELYAWVPASASFPARSAETGQMPPGAALCQPHSERP